MNDTPKIELTPMQDRALTQAINMLKGIGAMYRIEIGDFKVDTFPQAPVEKKRTVVRTHKYPHGAVTEHIKANIGKLQPGEYGIVPVAPFDLKVIRSVTTSWASLHWGKDSYISSTSKDETQIEILRY